MDVRPHRLLRLSSHSKQAGDESYLTENVSYIHPSHLSFPYHVHHLVSLQRSLCCLKRKEAQPRFDQSLDEESPHLITHVETTAATTYDGALTETIHTALANKNLLPEEHIVDSG